VDLSQVQGNIVPGFNKDHQAFVLVSFPSRSAGQAWLRAVAPEVDSAKDVLAFKAAYKTVDDLRRRQRQASISARWLNLALSWRGLQVLLGEPAVAGMPTAFRSNQVPFCQSSAGDDTVHALLTLGADDAAGLDSELAAQRAIFTGSGVREVRLYRGQALDDQREHFGFKDGVSCVLVDGVPPPDSCPPGEVPLAAGEFFFGEPDAVGQRVLPGPEWTRGGTFVAFMQLEQDVPAFRQAMHTAGTRLRLPYGDVRARLAGRDEHGQLAADPPLRLSHIGRAKPAWVAGVARHRIIRRGIPYGPPLADDATGSRDAERGLLFVSYQADLVRQFEQIWRIWLNGPDFPGPGAHRDGLVGQPTPGSSNGQRPVAISRGAPAAGVDQLSMPRFVTPHYGGYFIAPLLGALPRLAGS
jgi:deferrochelatase/peroxidase EfeB